MAEKIDLNEDRCILRIHFAEFERPVPEFIDTTGRRMCAIAWRCRISQLLQVIFRLDRQYLTDFRRQFFNPVSDPSLTKRRAAPVGNTLGEISWSSGTLELQQNAPD